MFFWCFLLFFVVFSSEIAKYHQNIPFGVLFETKSCKEIYFTPKNPQMPVKKALERPKRGVGVLTSSGRSADRHFDFETLPYEGGGKSTDFLKKYCLYR